MQRTQGELPEDLRQQITFIYCDDIAASEAFYRDKLELLLVRREDTPVRDHLGCREILFCRATISSCYNRFTPTESTFDTHNAYYEGQHAAFSGFAVWPPW
eukprot:COSAG02_NODE_35_length_49339_cov_20.375102_28_plen_101_part_00